MRYSTYSMEMSSGIFNERVSLEVSLLFHRNNIFVLSYFTQLILTH